MHVVLVALFGFLVLGVWLGILGRRLFVFVLTSRDVRQIAESQHVPRAILHRGNRFAIARNKLERTAFLRHGRRKTFRRQLPQPLIILHEVLSRLQIVAQALRLVHHVDNLQIFKRTLERIERFFIQLLIRRDCGVRIVTLLRIEHAQFSNTPLGLGRIRIVERHIRMRVPRRPKPRPLGRHHRHQLGRVVFDLHLRQIIRMQLEQILFDPIFETGRQFRRINFDHIHHILPGQPNITLLLRIAHRLAHNQINYRLAIFVRHRHPRADALLTGIELWLHRIDNAVLLMLARIAALDAQNLAVHQRVSRLGHLLRGIGRVVVLRRDRPQPVLLGHFKLARRRRVLIEPHDPQSLGHLRRTELVRQVLADKRFLIQLARRRRRGHPNHNRDQSDHDERYCFCIFSHR